MCVAVNGVVCFAQSLFTRKPETETYSRDYFLPDFLELRLICRAGLDGSDRVAGFRYVIVI